MFTLQIPGWQIVVSRSGMKPLERDQALCDGERPFQDDDPYITLAADSAARPELRLGDPAPLIPHLAKQRDLCLPDDGDAPDLDRVLVTHRGPLSESAPSTRGKGRRALPPSRCEAENGLDVTTTAERSPRQTDDADRRPLASTRRRV